MSNQAALLLGVSSWFLMSRQHQLASLSALPFEAAVPQAARLAGNVLLRNINKLEALNVVQKGRMDYASEVDADAEKVIVKELKRYDEELHDKPRWLVLNKLDMVPAEERAALVKDFVKRMKWKGPVFEISALTREGLEPLIHAVYEHVAAEKNPPMPDPDPRFDSPAAHDE